jgi:DNA sulfur modification protein DndB
MNRLMDRLEYYFSKLRDASEERWEAGKDGRIYAIILVSLDILDCLVSLFRFIERRDTVVPSQLSLSQLQAVLNPLIEPILTLIADASPEKFDEIFNVKLGSGGIKQYYFALSQCVNRKFPDFRPAGFEQWLSELGLGEQEKADKDARWIQGKVHSIVVDKLRELYGKKFFDRGISNKEIQIAAHMKRLDDEEEDRGGSEKYLEFLELRKIVEQKDNWPHFAASFNIPLPGQQKGLAKYVKWFDEVNRIRRVSAHPYQRTYSQQDLEILQIVTKKLGPSTVDAK